MEIPLPTNFSLVALLPQMLLLRLLSTCLLIFLSLIAIAIITPPLSSSHALSHLIITDEEIEINLPKINRDGKLDLMLKPRLLAMGSFLFLPSSSVPLECPASFFPTICSYFVPKTCNFLQEAFLIYYFLVTTSPTRCLIFLTKFP